MKVIKIRARLHNMIVIPIFMIHIQSYSVLDNLKKNIKFFLKIFYQIKLATVEDIFLLNINLMHMHLQFTTYKIKVIYTFKESFFL